METNDKIVEKNGKKYRLNLIIEKTATDLHHIMGKKYKHQYNVDIPQNKKRIPRRFHVNYNNFVEDRQSPRELFDIAYQMTKEVLSPGVREILETVIYKTDDDLFYIPELIKGKKKKKYSRKAKISESANTDS